MMNSQPPRDGGSAAKWPSPGIWVNVEFGVSMSKNCAPRSASLRYASRNMMDRIYHGQYDEGQQRHPVVPRNSIQIEGSSPHNRQQQQPRRPGPRSRDQRDRSRSVPPHLTDWNQPDRGINPAQPQRSYTDERRDRPLPPEPSRFRLGEDNLPWSVPMFYFSAEPDVPGPTIVTLEAESTHLEDPQRVRKLENLQRAMMTVDSIDHDPWDMWTWDNVGETPRGQRSVGWAVSSEDAGSWLSPAPSYLEAPWDGTLQSNRTRARSVG